MDDRIEYFIKKVQNCFSSFLKFNSFVADSEFFADQNKDLFSEEECVKYEQLWLDLEIINALVIEKWEIDKDSGIKLWEKTCKKDAEKTMLEIIAFFKNLQYIENKNE